MCVLDSKTGRFSGTLARSGAHSSGMATGDAATLKGLPSSKSHGSGIALGDATSLSCLPSSR